MHTTMHSQNTGGRKERQLQIFGVLQLGTQVVPLINFIFNYNFRFLINITTGQTNYEYPYFGYPDRYTQQYMNSLPFLRSFDMSEDDTELVVNIYNSLKVSEGAEVNFDFDFDFSPKQDLGLNDILKNIAKAKDDSRIEGIFLNLSSLSAGIATVEEIRN